MSDGKLTYKRVRVKRSTITARKLSFDTRVNWWTKWIVRKPLNKSALDETYLQIGELNMNNAYRETDPKRQTLFETLIA